MEIPFKLKKVIDCVLHCVDAEKIFLIGYIDRNGKARSPFTNYSIPDTPIREANILVVTKDCDKKALNDQIEQKCRLLLPVTCCVLSVRELVFLGQEGSIFVNTILSSDCIIYERTKKPLEVPFIPIGPGFIERCNKEIAEWYKCGIAFWKMARIQHRLHDNRMTAFCLHQATEQFLTMMIQAAVGYRLGTHNLPKLLRFLRFYNKDMRDVFACSCEDENQSLCILRESYITARYKIDFTISDEGIRYLMKEVSRLQSIAEKVLQEKLFGLVQRVEGVRELALKMP